MRNRFVRAERTKILGELTYSYQAVELRNGNLYPLGAKFLLENLAWAQIDVIEAREVRS
jgi:hypothetical protein